MNMLLCENISSSYDLTLTKEEIRKIGLVPLPRRLEADRKLLLLIYYARLNTSFITRPELTEHYFCYKCAKTLKFVIVPIHPVVRNLLGKLPPLMHSSATLESQLRRRTLFNRNIREIARLAGIDTKVPVKTKLKLRKVRQLFGLPEHKTIMVPKYRALNAQIIRLSGKKNKELCGMTACDIKLLGGKAVYQYYSRDLLDNIFTGKEKHRITELFHNEFFNL